MKRSMVRQLALFSAVLLVGCRAALADTYSFTTIDYLWGRTFLTGINNNGDIVGKFIGSSGEHGFVDTKGVFSVVDYPNAILTDANGINDKGQIVGTYKDATTGYHGFVEDNGMFASIDCPNSYGLNLYGINNSGDTVGTYLDALDFPHGVVDRNGVFTEINHPIPFVEAHGINQLGQIVGYYFDSTYTSNGFLLDDQGGFSSISYSLFPTNIVGVNDNGQTVGYYYDYDWNFNLVTHGLLDDNGVLTRIDYWDGHNASVLETSISGINDSGQMVGTYRDANGYHGFLATPNAPVAQMPEPGAVFLLGTCLIGVAVVSRRSMANGAKPRVRRCRVL